MKLLFDEELVEAAVLLGAAGQRAGIAPLQVRRFHSERERLYRILDPDERNAAFFQLHLTWFREWGLERLLTGPLAGFALLPGALAALAFRKARNKGEEAAELFVHPETGRHAVVALRPERFAEDEMLDRFLHHELMHLSDMVDPGFGYSPELALRGPSPTQARIVRDRYRLLWAITIDGRLARAGHAPQTPPHQHRALFDRAYAFWPEEKRQAVFDVLWSGDAPRHDALLALAADPRGLSDAQQPQPGGPCPLCGFPTFHWADAANLAPGIRRRIESEFPDWNPAAGVCGRCVEVYQSARFALPSTVEPG